MRLWDAHDGAPLTDSFEGRSGRVNSVAFSPDGARIVSGSDDRTIWVWGARTGIPITRPFRARNHAVKVTAVSFSPDSTRIIAGGSDGTVQVWDVQKAVLLQEFVELLLSPIVNVSFSPIGTRMASISKDCGVWVWDIGNNVLVTRSFGMDDIDDEWSSPPAVAITSDGTRIVSCVIDDNDLTDLPSTLIEVREVLPKNYPRTALLSDWHIDADGWIIDPARQALFWLPEDLCEIFPHPPTTLAKGIYWHSLGQPFAR